MEARNGGMLKVTDECFQLGSSDVSELGVSDDGSSDSK